MDEYPHISNENSITKDTQVTLALAAYALFTLSHIAIESVIQDQKGTFEIKAVIGSIMKSHLEVASIVATETGKGLANVAAKLTVSGPVRKRTKTAPRKRTKPAAKKKS